MLPIFAFNLVSVSLCSASVEPSIPTIQFDRVILADKTAIFFFEIIGVMASRVD